MELKGGDRQYLEDLAAQLGEPAYRGRQLFHWIYARNVADFEQMGNLPKNFRNALAEKADLHSVTLAQRQASVRGDAEKFLFRLRDGRHIESVLMRNEEDDKPSRLTLCISSQVGCPVDCKFCATGTMGLLRNLTAGEILDQVLAVNRLSGEHVTNVVVMGMGEPFHNYEATMAAVDCLNDPKGFDFGARRITLSTVGLAPLIERFAEERRQVNLAVSLHAATDDLRSELLPINKKYPLAVLFEAVRKYYATTRRRVTFEWALIQGKNDSVAQARALAGLAAGLPCHVNVIPLNPTRDYAGQAATRERAAAFKAALESRGLPCTIRVRRGIDINAGCGQLAVEEGRSHVGHPGPWA